MVSAEHVSTRSEPLNLKAFIASYDLPVIVGGCASYQTALHLNSCTTQWLTMPPPVSIALLISFLACAAFFGELASKEHTMFVSRKSLPFIHLVPTEAPPRLYMLQSLHQSVELLRAATSCCKLFQPFAEHSIERLMLRFGQQARLLDQLLIRTEGNVFHTKVVYTIVV